MNKTSKKIKKQKKIVYDCRPEDAERTNKTFIQNFPYNYWQHKINAIGEYIAYPEKIKDEIRFEPDNTLDESIVERFKMETHMTVFHSAETLFLILLGFLYEPNSIPMWISRCTSSQLQGHIEKLSKEGVNNLITNPNDWMRSVLYPVIDKNHSKFEDSKYSTKFTMDFIKRLAKEYVDHVEYNSYKHGLRCTSGQSRLQIKDEKSGKIVLDSSSDTINFLELEKIPNNNETIHKFKESSKTYDYERDCGIIRITTNILSNIFSYRQLLIKRELVGSDCKIKFLPFFFKFDKANKVFEFNPKNSKGGLITRFSFTK
ncbi:hypothetical protein [Nitrosopumilus sp.]|uniref:hypothetical protein n=1 Tax=Nitrosopumilus sp. TaxID=2024843 RepID=UPI0029308C90|nr:hypothetical protein [Nitrosopumilus sp.]